MEHKRREIFIPFLVVLEVLVDEPDRSHYGLHSETQRARNSILQPRRFRTSLGILHAIDGHCGCQWMWKGKILGFCVGTGQYQLSLQLLRVHFHPPTTLPPTNIHKSQTTIIESLKFAVCGSMPPGNKSGQAFVHDPRSIGTSIVKASVKLRFANQAGHTMVVVRSMEVQQKKTTLSFKQLDGVIRTAAGGQKKSMSHKCTGKSMWPDCCASVRHHSCLCQCWLC